MGFHLANMNIARFRYEPGDPRLAGFVDNLDRINGLAEQAEGFVWRLRDDTGNAMAIRAYEDPRIILNLSVWVSLEALGKFAYRSEHVQFFRRRAEWFEPHDGPAVALWWVRAGEVPSAFQARRRLEHLTRNGPSAEAFTFKDRFPSPLGAD